MFVKKYMTTDVVTTTEDVKITDAISMFEENKFHQMPVVDKNGKYIGLITEGIISKNSPSNATSLSIYEINYLLEKVTVGQLMDKDAATVSCDIAIEKAATLLLEQDRSVMTIVDDENHIQGIITDKDIFKALIDLTGYNDPGARFYVKVDEDRVGVLEEVTDVFADNDINISKIYVDGPTTGAPDGVIIQITSPDPNKALGLLETAGFEVSVVSD